MKAGKMMLVGLGNPGKEFENTYHNVGALALHEIADRLEGEGTPITFGAHKNLFRYAKVQNIILIFPLTFMNGSGKAVKEAIKKFGISPKDLTVIHDESDLPLGAYRESKGRGAAGHRGVQSIIDALHTNQFTRVRIGVREDGAEKRREKASVFVLRTVKPRHRKILDAVFETVTDHFTVKSEAGKS